MSVDTLPQDKLSYSQLSSDKIVSCINDGAGYLLGDMSPDDLQLIRSLVYEQYLHVLQQVVPHRVKDFYRQPMTAYHSLYRETDFNHATVWRKPARVLGPSALQRFFDTALFQTLNKLLPGLSVSDEEEYGWPNIYWRLVRPGNSDVGPVHADKWFWDLGHGETPEGVERLKIWIALHACPGQSGLRVVPQSHKSEQWRYHSEAKAGIIKPVIDEPEDELNLVSLPLNNGEFVIFHDRLLHGGMPNTSQESRVSLEFTMFVPK